MKAVLLDRCFAIWLSLSLLLMTIRAKVLTEREFSEIVDDLDHRRTVGVRGVGYFWHIDSSGPLEADEKGIPPSWWSPGWYLVGSSKEILPTGAQFASH